MRQSLVILGLLLLPAPASALCRCTCVEGVSRPICQPTDLMVPICQNLCLDGVRPVEVVRPLAGGQLQLDVVRPFEMNPQDAKERDAALTAASGRLQGSETTYDTDTRGYQLGTAGVQSGFGR